MNFNAVSHKELQELLPLVLASNGVPIIKGSPANAKSAIVAKYAKDSNLELIDVRLAQYDSLDIGGLPVKCEDGKQFKHLPLDVFPLKHRDIPKGKKGWLLFFDEILLAAPSVQNSAYKIILDKQVGQYDLHNEVQIVCASNLASDNASVVEENTALASRLIHFRLNDISLSDWKLWAMNENIDYRILAFVENNPEFLYKFDPDSNEDTFPSGRTWEFASRITVKVKELKDIHYLAVNGCVGNSAGSAFKAYCLHHKDLPTLEEILNSPKKAKLPTDIGAIFMIISMLSLSVSKKTTEKVMKYIDRMSVEYQVLFFRNTTSRFPNILSETCVKKWIKKNREVFI